MSALATEAELIAAARDLMGPGVRLSADEGRLVGPAGLVVPAAVLDALRAGIEAGEDPLGTSFCSIRSPKVRRSAGATYTPGRIVEAMVDWAATERPQPSRVVDPGAGSGRFLMAAAERFPDSALIAVETDPLAVLILRANAAVRGFADRLRVEVTDYRLLTLPETRGQTLFIGNPPYVRHHDIHEKWKDWFGESAKLFNIKASKLSGLHIHFFVKTLQLAGPGDYGAFITSAEWLDVNYGSVLRKLLADGLGGKALHVIDPSAMPFADATTTGAITCFAVGNRPKSMRVRAVPNLDELNGLSAGRAVPWSKLSKSSRWSTIVRPTPRPPAGYIELGALCRVHRGQVTGRNDVWIAGEAARDLPARCLFAAVTKARELVAAGDALVDDTGLRRVVDLPADLGALDGAERKAVDRFLRWARRQGADQGYIARHRRAWWSVGLKAPAPVLCTYMARRPPSFVRNACGARHLNIAHGLYPRESLAEELLAALVAWLRGNVRIEAGRTYAGGLTKFEPGELERIAVPRPEHLIPTVQKHEHCEHRQHAPGLG